MSVGARCAALHRMAETTATVINQELTSLDDSSNVCTQDVHELCSVRIVRASTVFSGRVRATTVRTNRMSNFVHRI